MSAPVWTPAATPQGAAGYWWDPVTATGIGTAGFKVPEAGGHTAFDLPQATTTSQPTVLTENGGVQFRMRNAADPNPSILTSAGNVTAGWAGATYFCMWVRHPDGQITSGNNAYFIHSLTTGNQRRYASSTVNGTPDLFSVTQSTDGTAQQASRWAHWTTATFTFVEQIYDPLLTLGGSGFIDKIKLFYGLTLQARTLNAATDPTQLFDGLAPIIMMTRVGGLLANADTTDWAFAGYFPGIPSLADRVRIGNYRNPTGVPLAA